MSTPANPAEERREVLLFAAKENRTDIIGKVLDEEKQDPEGDVRALLEAREKEAGSLNTALHIACIGGHVDAARVLLLRGGDASLQNAAGQCATHLLANGKGRVDLQNAFEAEFFRRAASGEAEGIEQLLVAGMDPCVEQGGHRASAWAEMFNHSQLANRLSAAEKGESTSLLTGSDAGMSESAQGPSSSPRAATVASSPRGGTDDSQPGELNGATVAPRPPPAIFPLLWPPVRSARHWGQQGGDEPSVIADSSASIALPLAASRAMYVELPPSLDPRDAAALLAVVEKSLGDISASATARVGDNSKPNGHTVASYFAAPLVVPCFFTCPSEGIGLGREEDAVVGFIADQDADLGQSSFRINLVPADKSSRSPGRLEVLANDAAGLRSASEILRQLLCQHGELDPLARQLRLPAAAIEDGPPSRGLPEAPAVLLDVWQLQEPAAPLAQLRGWRLQRLYVPLPLQLDGVAGKGEFHAGPIGLQQVFEFRRAVAAEAGGPELVPVLTINAGEPLDATAGRPGAVVAELLAQFGLGGRMGLRFSPGSLFQGLDDPLQAAERALARLDEVHQLSRSILGYPGYSVHLWLPFDDQLLSSVCAAARPGSSGPPPVTIVLEITDGVNPGVASAKISAFGLRNLIFIPAPGNAETGKESPLCSSKSASCPRPVPFVVWPGAGIRERAKALNNLLSQAQSGGCCGAVSEIPVYGVPWAGKDSTGTWCSATAFLATGYETGLAVIRPPENGTDGLGALLAAQLLGILGQKQAQAASSLALALFDEVPHKDPNRALGPPGSAQPLLDLLGGKLPSSLEEKDAAARASIWHQHLSRRKQRLKALSHEDLHMSSAHSVLQAVLLGVEWLLFGCQVIVFLSKHGAKGAGSLRSAMQSLPPAKGSDVRNNYLNLVDQTVGKIAASSQAGGYETNSAQKQRLQAAALENLWHGGLRVGAALDLEPWVSFASLEK